MAEVEYSRRLGVLSDDQLQAALRRFGLGNLVSAQPISTGLFGQNLFLTSTSGEFVLRGAPHYDWQFPTEKFFVEQLHTRTRVPVPYPYLVDPSTDIFGWSFVLMPRLPGLQIAEGQVISGLAEEDRRGIARALAEMLVEAHRLTWDFDGSYDPKDGRVRPSGLNYRNRIAERTRDLLQTARRHNDHTTASDLRWAESIIEQASSASGTPYQPSIVLEDYKEPNTVVERGPDGWRVSGVFDLMTAHFGDGEADLSRQLGAYLRDYPVLADEYIGAYLRNSPVGDGFLERQRLYMLYDSAIIWAFWQGHADGLPEDKTLSFEQWAGPFVGYWDGHRQQSK